MDAIAAQLTAEFDTNSDVNQTAVWTMRNWRGDTIARGNKTATTRRLRVFLCHASGDKPKVRSLYERLKTDRFEPWLDEEDLLPGQQWQVEIPKAVRNADVVLVCLSRHSVTKDGYVQKEIKLALDTADEKVEHTIFLIPARLDDCPLPDRLRSFQAVDLSQEHGYEKLAKALREREISLAAL
jgi:hypothetical protein